MILVSVLRGPCGLDMAPESVGRRLAGVFVALDRS